MYFLTIIPFYIIFLLGYAAVFLQFSSPDASKMNPDHQISAALKEQRSGHQNDNSIGQIFMNVFQNVCAVLLFWPE